MNENKAVCLTVGHSLWEFQKSYRLVYCNLLEHLLLHIKIEEQQWWGFGNGATDFIIPFLNDIYSGVQYQKWWKQNVAKTMLPLKQEYFSILKYFIKKNKNIGNLVRSRECNRHSKKPLSHQHYLFFREMMTKLDLKHNLLKSKIIQWWI